MTALRGQTCKPAVLRGVQAYSQATTWEATEPSPDPTAEPRSPPVTGARSWSSEPFQSGGVSDPTLRPANPVPPSRARS